MSVSFSSQGPARQNARKILERREWRQSETRDGNRMISPLKFSTINCHLSRLVYCTGHSYPCPVSQLSRSFMNPPFSSLQLSSLSLSLPSSSKFSPLNLAEWLSRGDGDGIHFIRLRNIGGINNGLSRIQIARPGEDHCLKKTLVIRGE